MDSSESVLFKLPKYVFLNFCSDWISVIDFCKLDSSVTNFNLRSLYETYAATGNLLISDDGAGTSLTSHCFDWLMKRNFSIKKLTAPADVLPIKKLLLRKNARKIFKSLKCVSMIDRSVNDAHSYAVKKMNGKNKGILLAGRQEAFIQNCISLESLDISKSNNTLSAKFYESVSANCPLLRKLVIGGGVTAQNGYEGPHIPLSAALVTVTKGCKLLEEVRCDAVLSTELIVSLAENCIHLKVFESGQNPKQPSDRFLVAFGEHCAQLREISICSQFTENGFEKFVNGCSFLTKLRFGHRCKLTDHSVTQLATRCAHLTSLDMEYSSSALSVSAIEYLLKHCKALTHLKLNASKLIDKLCDVFVPYRYTLKFVSLFCGGNRENRTASRPKIQLLRAKMTPCIVNDNCKPGKC